MLIFEKIKVKSIKRNQFIDITDEISKIISKHNVQNAILKIFIPHTTAAVTINEGADPSVLVDMEKGLETISPILKEYKHLEGNSDAHIKSSIIGNTQEVFIKDGNIILGTWQKIYFCEFDGPRTRSVEIAIRD